MSLKSWIAISLFPQILLVEWLGTQTAWVERWYSQGIYPHISFFFRTIFGWIPFSVGDICYTFLTVLAIGYVYRQWTYIKAYPLTFARNILMVCSVLYFSFYILWGLNYYREPLRQKMELVETNDSDRLIHFTKKLIQKTNEVHFSITKDTTQKVTIPYNQEMVFQKAVAGYKTLGGLHPYLLADTPSIKTSLYSTALTYMGYAGYLNPFTGEAQVNGLLPNFRFPVVAAHEMGHQLGYSAENETNFIGYLVTVTHPDPYFNYAGYAYALGYCLNDIRKGDEELFQTLFAQLNKGVALNYKEMNDFWTAYENPMEPFFKAVFNSFLKANHQDKGIDSYNAMVALLVAYHQKHPL